MSRSRVKPSDVDAVSRALLSSSVPGKQSDESTLAAADGLRLDYFRREIGDSFDRVLASYRALVPAVRSGGRTRRSLEPALRRILERDWLEDGRRRNGLDALRTQLFDRLLEAASFEEGLEFLCRRIDGGHVRKKTLQPPLGLDRSTEGLWKKMGVVAEHYPDLTADEVSLCGLLDDANQEFLPDVETMLFHPVVIVGMAVDGLLFYDGSCPERDLDSLWAVSAPQVGGISGLDPDTSHFPFRPEIARAVRALVLLRVSSTDLFDKLFREEDVGSLLRGDAMLLREFLTLRMGQAAAGSTTSSLEELLSASAGGGSTTTLKEEVRAEIARYLSGCCFWNRQGTGYSRDEVVRLFGLLVRLPGFVRGRTPFKGHVLHHGGSLEFVDGHGAIADRVPLAGYLQARLIQDFHDRTVSSSRTDRILLDLFSELRDRILDREISLGHRMPSDVLQGKVLTDFDVLLPIHAHTRLKRCSNFAEFYISNKTTDTSLERSMRFGLAELRLLERTLSCVPRVFLQGVRVVSKRLQEGADYGMFLERNAISGGYHPLEKRIEIRIPPFGLIPDSPFEELREAVCGDQELGESKLARLKAEVELERHYLLHVFLHEVGESIAAASRPALRCWRRLCPPGSRVPVEERRRHFLSLYGTVNQKEDFCDTFAVYVLYGRSFRKRARRSPVLRSKYEFMRRLFVQAGATREFGDMFSHSMDLLLRDPRSTWKNVDRGELLDSLEKERQALDSEVRDAFAEEALSYQDVESVIEEKEALGEEITERRAAEDLQRRLRSASEEDEELAGHRRFRVASWQVRQLFASAGVPSAESESLLEDLFLKIMDGTPAEVTAILGKLGVKRGRKNLLERLSSIFRCFEDEFRKHFEDCRRAPLFSEGKLGQILSALFSALPATVARGSRRGGRRSTRDHDRQG